MTEGESRYIKQHTEKTFRELNIKGVNMKSTKKTVAHTTNPIVGKLLRLKYKINEAYHNGGSSFENIGDKKWVWTLVEDIQNKRFTKLCREDFEKCNGLWRQYA